MAAHVDICARRNGAFNPLFEILEPERKPVAYVFTDYELSILFLRFKRIRGLGGTRPGFLPFNPLFEIPRAPYWDPRPLGILSILFLRF